MFAPLIPAHTCMRAPSFGSLRSLLVSESMWSTVVCPTDKAVAPCEEPDHQSIEYKIIRDFTTAACMNLPVRGEHECDPCDHDAACATCRCGLWD